ncbi:MAG TPA: PepSY-associated TM helix domain-containing protein, partial [Flavipsychrobacter sp.]|nr:PepSY-associated TM helix domain-containing protein [Flavipsychrobacter sp.]
NDGNLRISLPNDSLGNFGVNKYQTGFFAWSASDKMQIDQYTGKILKVDRFTDKPLNQKIAETIKSLHVGDLSGTSSKIIWFIACLIGTSLPITGTIIWINKLKKKKPKKQTSYQSKLIVEMA